MKPITYILCAAGEGSRFQVISRIPKPLLKLNGKTFLEHAIQSLPIRLQDELVIVTQKKHAVPENCLEDIHRAFPFHTIYWEVISDLTKGQLETAYNAALSRNPEHGLVIYNADTAFQSNTCFSFFSDPTIDGAAPCAIVDGDMWSFFKTHEEGFQVESVAEKKRISQWASVGFYYFRSLAVFLELAKEALAQSSPETEQYVAPLYNQMIEKGLKVVVDPVSGFFPFGTPEQLEAYWKVSKAALLKQNTSKVLVVDLDNTITIEDPKYSYSEKKPNLPLIKKLQDYHQNGYKIIIFSARRMKTHQNNEAAVVADMAEVTMQWLKKHQVPCDGLKFGKPYAENGFYIDDRAIRPSEFLSCTEEELFQRLV